MQLQLQLSFRLCCFSDNLFSVLSLSENIVSKVVCQYRSFPLRLCISGVGGGKVRSDIITSLSTHLVEKNKVFAVG